MVALSKPEDLGPPPRDGWVTRSIKPHSKQKAHYWCRYAETAATATKNVFQGARACLDLYAAAGICEDSESRELSWGSSLLALQVTTPFDLYFFNDIDPEATAALAARVRMFAPQGTSIFEIDLDDPNALSLAREISRVRALGTKVVIARGDANKTPVFVKELLPHGRRYTLALIDPQSAKFHWSALEALAHHERSFDVLSLFPDASDLARGLPYYLNRPKCGEKLDAYFGTREWREIVRHSPKRAEHELRQFYEQRMNTYLDLKAGHPKGVGFSRRPLYHLIFGSKNEKGIKLWNDVNRRTPWDQDELFFPSE